MGIRLVQWVASRQPTVRLHDAVRMHHNVTLPRQPAWVHSVTCMHIMFSGRNSGRMGDQHVHTILCARACTCAGCSIAQSMLHKPEKSMYVSRMRLTWPCLERFREGMTPYTPDTSGAGTRACAHSAAVVTQYSSTVAAYFPVCGEHSVFADTARPSVAATMPPKVLRGALKNKGEKVYTSGGQGTSAIPLTPGTLYISSSVGIGKRGVDLQACYQVPEGINCVPRGFNQ
jgi:hypothetical protein